MFWKRPIYSTLHPIAPLGGHFVATIGFFLVPGDRYAAPQQYWRDDPAVSVFIL